MEWCITFAWSAVAVTEATKTELQLQLQDPGFHNSTTDYRENGRIGSTTLPRPSFFLSYLLSFYGLPLHDSDLRASHARALLPSAWASVSFGRVYIGSSEKGGIRCSKH